MPSEPERIVHKSPCAYFLAHKQEFAKAVDEIDDLKLCYTKLNSIEITQRKQTERQEEFLANHSDIKTSLALLLQKVDGLSSSIASVKAETLCETDIKLMLTRFSQDFPNEEKVALLIENKIANVKDALKTDSRALMWKATGLAVSGCSILMGAVGLAIKFL